MPYHHPTTLIDETWICEICAAYVANTYQHDRFHENNNYEELLAEEPDAQLEGM